MGTGWITAGKGIRYREHPTRRYGNHLDRYYSLFYKVKGKTHTEALGWESENREPGRSMLKRAEELMAQIRQNRRTGQAPVVKKERVELEEARVAEAKAERLQAQIKNITLSEFFDTYFVPHAQRKLGNETFQHECSHFKCWIKEILGDVPIQDIKFRSWEPLLGKLFSSKKAIRTIIDICGTLCRILKYARDLEYDVYIPTMKKLGLEQDDNRRLRVITAEELKDIFDALGRINPYAYNITFFAFSTGCRFSEAAKLKWVDIQNKSIYFRDTKNGTTRRIPLTDQVSELLSQIPRTENEYIFPQANGKPYSEPPTTFKLVVDNLKLNEGYGERNKITFHSLRHTAATLMAEHLDVRSLMDIFGWKSITMAARYLHGNEEKKYLAMNSLGDYLNPTKEAKIIQFSR